MMPFDVALQIGIECRLDARRPRRTAVGQNHLDEVWRVEGTAYRSPASIALRVLPPLPEPRPDAATPSESITWL
jgi:hypothetical protein